MTITGTLPPPAVNNTGLYEGLKVVFEPTIAQTLTQDTEVYDLFTNDLNVPVTQTGGGRYIELAHYAADGGGFGARREGGTLPESTPPSIYNGRLLLKKNHMTVEMTGETMRRVQGGEVSWINWAKDALPNATRRLRHHLDRQALGTGQGAVGRVAAVATNANGTATVTIDRAFGTAAAKSGAVYQLLQNDLVRFAADVNGVTLRDTVRSRIVDVDTQANKFTIDNQPALLAAGDYVTLGDSADHSLPGAANADLKEMMGLYGMIDDGAYRPVFQNVDRATRNQYRSVVIDATAQVGPGFTEDHVLLADDVVFQTNGGMPDIIIGNRAQERSYYKAMRNRIGSLDPRSALNSGGKDRGFTINVNGREVRFRVARKLPQEDAFFVERGSLKKWQVGSGFAFDTTTGSVFERVVTAQGRFDAFYAVGVVEGEMGTLLPGHSVAFRNITGL